MSNVRSVALVLLLGLAACSNIRSEEARKNSARVEAENALLIVGRYPKTIDFHNEVVHLRPGGPAVCGEFSGMNRDAEWINATRFLFADRKLSVDNGKPDFAARWTEACSDS